MPEDDDQQQQQQTPAGADDEKITSAVGAAVDKAFAPIRAALGLDDENDDDEPPAGDDVTQQQQQPANDDLEGRVRSVMDRVNREQQTDTRLQQLEERTKEEPPKKFRRITEILWGSGKKADK